MSFPELLQCVWVLYRKHGWLTGVPSFITFVSIKGNLDAWLRFTMVPEMDLLCLETLSVTLALSSEMLSLTSLTYDSSSEPCEGNTHAHKLTAVCQWLTDCSNRLLSVPLQYCKQDTAAMLYSVNSKHSAAINGTKGDLSLKWCPSLYHRHLLLVKA